MENHGITIKNNYRDTDTISTCYVFLFFVILAASVSIITYAAFFREDNIPTQPNQQRRMVPLFFCS